MKPINASKLTVTSKFGKRTITYQGKKETSYHKGIDLVPNPRNNNAEILAVADGTVTSVCTTGKQYGQACYVRIKHNNGYQTLYYHLKSGSICVKKNDKVKKGQKIGIIGATGKATGIHLHFQIDKGSSATAIDPYDYIFKGKAFETSTSNGGFFPSKGWFGLGDRHENVGKIASFMRKTFPAYTKKEALGNYYGKYIQASIKEFQKRTGLETDGNVGSKTLAKLKQYGFKD